MEKPGARVVTLVVILCAGIFFWRLNTVIQDAIELSYPTVTSERLLVEGGIALGIFAILGAIYWRWGDIMALVPGPHEALVKSAATTAKPETKAKKKKKTVNKDSMLKEVFIVGKEPPPPRPSSSFFRRGP